MGEPNIREINLPGLQTRLDALRAGERLTIGPSTYERLFGVNDVAQRRAANFASGHGCSLEVSRSAITFRKAPPGARPPF